MRAVLTIRSSASALLALGLVIAIAAAVGFGIGMQVGAGPRMSEVKVFRDVPAVAGDAQVSSTVDGVTYGVSGEVAWVDASGSYHENGWPACVPLRTQSRITFGGAWIYGPTQVASARIVWVDCRK